MEKHSINFKSQINNKVDNSVFEDTINKSKKNLETFQWNLSCLKSQIENLLLKHPNPMTGDDVINNDSLGYDLEILNLSISSQISKCVNDVNDVIVFNLKEHVNKVEDDKLVESLIVLFFLSLVVI